MAFYLTLINKEHPLAADFVPEDLIPCDFAFAGAISEEKRLLCRCACEAAARLFEYGKVFGHLFYGISGYRSYQRQEELYQKRCLTMGEEDTKQYLALPGTSEHQSGLALDVSCSSLHLELEPAFAETPEGRWLEKYAPMFGFIIRYPKGKEKITGYAWEPWHIRYVSKPLALFLSLTGQTLEEYYQ